MLVFEAVSDGGFCVGFEVVSDGDGFVFEVVSDGGFCVGV